MEEKRKIHLVRWAVICKDKRHEGLSLRHLKVFNHALLGKWLWRFPLERESFWRKVIVAKFGEEKGFIRGFRVMGRNGEGASVSHLLFADDTLLFCEDNRNQLVF